MQRRLQPYSNSQSEEENCWLKTMEMQSCGKTFMNHSSLTRHKKCHTEDKPREHLKYCEKVCKCKECGKAFISPSALRTHDRSHTGKKLYEYYQCGKVFSIKIPSNYAKELPQDRNLTTVKNVGKPSCGK